MDLEKRKAKKKGRAKRLLAALPKMISLVWERLKGEGGENVKAFSLFLGERAPSRPLAAFLLASFLCAGAGCIVSLAAFPFASYPAGFSLLASLGGVRLSFVGSGKGQGRVERCFLLSVFSGVLFSAAFQGARGIFYLLAYLILFFLRAYFTSGSFRDSVLARVTLSSAVATGLGLVFAFFDSFHVNSLFTAVSLGLLTPLLTYLISGFYVYSAVEVDGVLAEKKKVYLAASLLAVYFLFLYALREWEVFGVSFSFLPALGVTLWTARRRGALFGGTVGLIGGMASLTPALAPCLAVGGFFGGLFFEYSQAVALMVAFVTSCGYSLFVDGLVAFSDYASSFAVAMAVVFPILHFLPAEERPRVKSAPREAVHRETLRRAGRKLTEMSDAFSSLSEVFYTVSDTMKKPSLTEVSRMVSETLSEFCTSCPNSSACWGRDSALTAETGGLAASRLLSEGRVDGKDFAAPFQGACPRLGDLAEKVNRRYERMCGVAENRKTGLLAGEYSAVSRLLKSTAGDLGRELEYNPALEEKAKAVLEELGIRYRRVAVFGSREMKIDVYGVSPERVGVSSDRLIALFGKAFGCRFDAPDFMMFEESVLMRLRRKRVMALECAKSGCTKSGESVSGDSCRFFETPRDYFYTLICDGMGSGREAAFTSRLASIFIEKLMHCATPKNVTLEMLNTFLMAKTDETFTTVDLLEVDLLSGKANFIKAGAAPSFVLRGDRLHRIESRTPPAGALVKMCAEQTTFPLKEGDFVILMSDGAAEDGDTGWLMRLLAGESFGHAAQLCDRIFSVAREKGAFRDDLSVSVIRIMNAQ